MKQIKKIPPEARHWVANAMEVIHRNKGPGLVNKPAALEQLKTVFLEGNFPPIPVH